VEPDLVVPSMFDHLKTGEQHMDYSLAWDQVERVDFDHWRGHRFDVIKAEKEGRRWVDTNPVFKKIQAEAEKARSRSEQTRVTVSLSAMWQERQQLAASRKEAQAMGLLPEGDDEEEMKLAEDNKKLDEMMADDPLVQMSVFLIQDTLAGEASVGLSR
jgi:carboxyl-terminal processing protease